MHRITHSDVFLSSLPHLFVVRLYLYVLMWMQTISYWGGLYICVCVCVDAIAATAPWVQRCADKTNERNKQPTSKRATHADGDVTFFSSFLVAKEHTYRKNWRSSGSMVCKRGTRHVKHIKGSRGKKIKKKKKEKRAVGGGGE